ncbi:MAG: DUF1580 domain-containing protein [Planctomycetes bacterium]|nr:DUF1580 domain-containing protein [Planctomycetota bacterium]
MNERNDSQISPETPTYRVDPLRDRLLPLRKLGSWHKDRTGESLHRSVPYRWAQIGVGGIRLPTVRLGGTRYTSEEAIAWWTAAINGGASA